MISQGRPSLSMTEEEKEYVEQRVRETFGGLEMIWENEPRVIDLNVDDSTGHEEWSAKTIDEMMRKYKLASFEACRKWCKYHYTMPKAQHYAKKYRRAMYAYQLMERDYKKNAST